MRQHLIRSPICMLKPPSRPSFILAIVLTEMNLRICNIFNKYEISRYYGNKGGCSKMLYNGVEVQTIKLFFQEQRVQIQGRSSIVLICLSNGEI